ncbi:MAG: radical SAM protein [Candidatus Gottesmanbacteria bacterium]
MDARENIADVLVKQLRSGRFTDQQIYIGTVTDPYQPVERKYLLTRQILKVLKDFHNPVSILTKSDLVLRDLDLLKQLKNVDVNFTITTLDEKWAKLTEPFAPTINQRLRTIEQLSNNNIHVFVMMGPYWPIFTDPEKLFKKFKEIGVVRVFTESFNTYGGNFSGVEDVLIKHYPELLLKIKSILFDKKKFYEFYSDAKKNVEKLSADYFLPTTIYFGLGHAGKFKNN